MSSEALLVRSLAEGSARRRHDRTDIESSCAITTFAPQETEVFALKVRPLVILSQGKELHDSMRSEQGSVAQNTGMLPLTLPGDRLRTEVHVYLANKN